MENKVTKHTKQDESVVSAKITSGQGNRRPGGKVINMHPAHDSLSLIWKSLSTGICDGENFRARSEENVLWPSLLSRHGFINRKNAPYP